MRNKLSFEGKVALSLVYLCCGLLGWLFDEPHHLHLSLSLLRLCMAPLSLDLGTDKVSLHGGIRSEEG